MLVENSLKNDLQSANQYIAGLACCAIGNISSAEICRDLSPEVEKLMAAGCVGGDAKTKLLGS